MNKTQFIGATVMYGAAIALVATSDLPRIIVDYFTGKGLER